MCGMWRTRYACPGDTRRRAQRAHRFWVQCPARSRQPMFEQEGPSTAPAPEVATPESSTPGAPASTEGAGEAPAAPAPAAPAPETAPPAEPETPPSAGPTFGGTNAEGEYEPMQVVSDDLGGMSFADAISGTIVEFDEGDIVTGTVVKVDKDEVLLDIGYKSEGVIPNRELSIRHDVDPH